MNTSFFEWGIRGESGYLPDKRTRARWVVADAFREIAKSEEKSMAARIRIIAGDIENGINPSRKAMLKIGPKRRSAAYRIFVRLCKEKMEEVK